MTTGMYDIYTGGIFDMWARMPTRPVRAGRWRVRLRRKRSGEVPEKGQNPKQTEKITAGLILREGNRKTTAEKHKGMAFAGSYRKPTFSTQPNVKLRTRKLSNSEKFQLVGQSWICFNPTTYKS
ncbi:MAG: hypothetical protein GX565_00095 [Lentisphaerae bacterium]|nr:hypothetical protein [Lentisphaerota bacterium]